MACRLGHALPVPVHGTAHHLPDGLFCLKTYLPMVSRDSIDVVCFESFEFVVHSKETLYMFVSIFQKTKMSGKQHTKGVAVDVIYPTEWQIPDPLPSGKQTWKT